MSVSFKELGGSPVEQYGLEGFRAVREFLIAWDDRDAFAGEILGAATQHAGANGIHYPGKPTAFAVSLRYEPFDPDNPDLQDLRDLTQGLNRYSGSFAKAIVEYRTVNPRDRTDGPENEAGTHLTYRMEFGVEVREITPQGWKWADTPSVPLPTDLPLVKHLPFTDHHLTWQQVVRPPWDALRELQGKINATTFLDCPAGTVLFLGAEANKLFRDSALTSESNFCWQIHYVFRERGVKHGGHSYGWNHAFRPDPAGWAEVTDGVAPPYDSADFSVLFQSQT
jgi:hypothetical protein